MDIERKNFLKELETEFDINIQNNASSSPPRLSDKEIIEDIFNEAVIFSMRLSKDLEQH